MTVCIDSQRGNLVVAPLLYSRALRCGGGRKLSADSLNGLSGHEYQTVQHG